MVHSSWYDCRQMISIESAPIPPSFNSPHLTSPSSSPPTIYEGNIQGALILAIEITNAYDFAIQISTALDFVIEMWKRIWFLDKHPDLLWFNSLVHISVLIYYIWSTRVAIFFLWVCNFFLRSAFFFLKFSMILHLTISTFPLNEYFIF